MVRDTEIKVIFEKKLKSIYRQTCNEILILTFEGAKANYIPDSSN